MSLIFRFKDFLRRYLPFTRASFSVALMYRTHILLWIFSSILEIGMMMLVWVAVYKNSETGFLHGFALSDMLLYNILITMTFSLTRMNPLWDVAEDYYDGKIAMSLIKPINYKTQVFFQNLGGNLFSNVILTLPITIIFVFTNVLRDSGLILSPASLLLYIFSVIMGLLINFYANFIFAMLVFKTEATFGLFQLNEVIVRIFSGALIPLTFFPSWFRIFAEAMPYASVQYIPTLILMNRLEGNELLGKLALQAAWVIFLIIFTRWLWSRSLAKLKVHGG